MGLSDWWNPNPEAVRTGKAWKRLWRMISKVMSMSGYSHGTSLVCWTSCIQLMQPRWLLAACQSRPSIQHPLKGLDQWSISHPRQPRIWQQHQCPIRLLPCSAGSCFLVSCISLSVSPCLLYLLVSCISLSPVSPYLLYLLISCISFVMPQLYTLGVYTIPGHSSLWFRPCWCAAIGRIAPERMGATIFVAYAVLNFNVVLWSDFDMLSPGYWWIWLGRSQPLPFEFVGKCSKFLKVVTGGRQEDWNMGRTRKDWHQF